MVTGAQGTDWNACFAAMRFLMRVLYGWTSDIVHGTGLVCKAALASTVVAWASTLRGVGIDNDRWSGNTIDTQSLPPRAATKQEDLTLLATDSNLHCYCVIALATSSYRNSMFAHKHINTCIYFCI